MRFAVAVSLSVPARVIALAVSSRVVTDWGVAIGVSFALLRTLKERLKGLQVASLMWRVKVILEPAATPAVLMLWERSVFPPDNTTTANGKVIRLELVFWSWSVAVKVAPTAQGGASVAPLKTS